MSALLLIAGLAFVPQASASLECLYQSPGAVDKVQDCANYYVDLGQDVVACQVGGQCG